MSIIDQATRRALRKGDKGDAVRLVQTALRSAGHEVLLDGDFGGATHGAVKDFQIAHKLHSDGVVGPITAIALDAVLSGSIKPKSDSLLTVKPLESVKAVVPWLTAMRAITGIKEVGGGADSPVILSWVREIVETYPDLKGTIGWYNHDSIPWCGLATAYCMTKAGYKPPKLALGAVNWLNDWQDGVRLTEPELGAVLVKSRTGGGHVTFYEGEDRTYYYCRGGNQSDMVNVAAIKKDNTVKGFMWPKDAPRAGTGRVMTSFADARAGGSEA